MGGIVCSQWWRTAIIESRDSGDAFDGDIFTDEISFFLVEFVPDVDKGFLVRCVTDTVGSHSGTCTGTSSVWSQQSKEFEISEFSAATVAGIFGVKIDITEDVGSIHGVCSICVAIHEV